MRKPTPKEFVETVENNEESMPEHAAFYAACQMHGIDEDEGYDLMIAYEVEK